MKSKVVEDIIKLRRDMKEFSEKLQEIQREQGPNQRNSIRMGNFFTDSFEDTQEYKNYKQSCNTKVLVHNPKVYPSYEKIKRKKWNHIRYIRGKDQSTKEVLKKKVKQIVLNSMKRPYNKDEIRINIHRHFPKISLLPLNYIH